MNDKMKFLAISMISLMIAVSIISHSDDNEASVGDGGLYSYTITYDQSGMATGTDTVSVANMTPISQTNPNINQALDPGSWTWNANGRGPFNSFYAAYDLTQGNRFYAVLNPNNLNQTIDGRTLSPLSNYNIMWVLPTVYWLTDSSGNLTLTNNPNAGGTAYAHTIDGHVYKYVAYGVYEGSEVMINEITYLASVSGANPWIHDTKETFRTASQAYAMSYTLNTSSSYPAYSMMWTFYQWELYKYCSLAVTEDWNVQAVVGGGHTYGDASLKTTGLDNTRSPYAGRVMPGGEGSIATGSDSVKLFIENVWGNINEYVDGVLVDGTTGLYISQASDLTDAKIKQSPKTAMSLPTSSNYYSTISTDAATWGFPVSGPTATATTGLADYYSLSTTVDGAISVGGLALPDGSFSVRAGLSYMSITDGTGTTSRYGSRLAFVFDADPVPLTTVTVMSSNSNFGTVSTNEVADVPVGSTITVSGSTITFNGTTITATPTTDTAQYDYSFSGWSVQNGATVTEDMAITATFDRERGYYSYTLVYNAAGMSNSSATISVANMTPISHTSSNKFESLDPGSWTWDSTTGIGPFGSFYGAFDMTQGNTLFAILNPSNLTQTIDGQSLSPLSNYNIMWVLPTVYWLTDSSGNLTLTDNPNAGGSAYAHTIDGHVYRFVAYGVYEGSQTTVNSKTVLTSTSGTNPTVSQNRETFRTNAHNYDMSSSLNTDNSHPAYSMQWNFYMWELYKYCALATMEDWNSQAIVGGGHTYGGTYVFQTGATNSMGAYAGYPMTGTSGSSTTGSNSVKLFIENAWGGVSEFVDGVVVNGRTGIYISQSSNPTDTVTKETTMIPISLPTSNDYYRTISTSATTWGFQVQGATATATTGVADYIYTSTSADRVLDVGGNSNSAASNSVRYGLSYASAGGALSGSSSGIGSRLAFVFDAGPASSTTVSVGVNNPSYGSVDVSSVSDVTVGSTITVSDNTITIDGTTITATPTTDTAQYDYSFISWSVQNGDAVTEDMTITATFSRAVNEYTVTVKGTVPGGSVDVGSVTVPYGTAITASGNILTIGSTVVTATPSEPTAQYTYSFSRWSGYTSPVTQDLSITAIFVRSVNEYAVAIVSNNADYGTVSESSVTVPYGTAISTADNTLTIGANTITATPTTDTAQYDYDFTGWTNATGTVTGQMTITANFTRSVAGITVTIASNNADYGTVSESSVTVPYGTAISSNGPTLTIGSETVTATPATATAQYTYTFSSWSNATGTITSARTVTANFTATVNTYTVTFQSDPSGYGTTSRNIVTNVPYGMSITASGDTVSIGSTTVTALPTTATAQYTYSFSSWSNATGTVIGPTTITANFSRALNSYTVSFQASPSGYGTVSGQSIADVDYGTVISVSGNAITIDGTTITATPTADTAQYDYGFSGWSVTDGSTVGGNMTITANFARAIQNYTVTIQSNDEDWGTVDVGSIPDTPYDSAIHISGNKLTLNGTVVTATEETATVEYTYGFDGYETDGQPVQDGAVVRSDMTIIAKFVRTPTTYIVMLTPNNPEWGSVTVSEISGISYGTTIHVSGDSLTIDQTTSRATASPSTAQYTYAFIGWSVADGTTVSDDMDVTAIFSRMLNTYTVTVQDDGSGFGSVSPSTVSSVPYGTRIAVSGNTITVNGTTVTATPLASDSQYDYEFSGWSIQANHEVTGNLTVTASFERYLKGYEVSFQVNNSDYGSVSESLIRHIPYGSAIAVSGNTVTIDDYTITATPTRADAQYTYAFSSWTNATGTVEGDMTITANFTATVNNYTVTIESNNTDYGTVSESSVTVPYGTAIATTGNILFVNGTRITATPSEADAQYTYAFSTWSNITGPVAGDTTITANFTATVNTYTVTIESNNTDYGTVSPSTVASVPYGTIMTSTGNILHVNGVDVTATASPGDEQYRYDFSEWTGTMTVRGPTTVTANFTATVSEYTVIIVPNNSNYGSVNPSTVTNVPYGTVVTTTGATLNIGNTPIIATPSEADAQYTYSFGAWTNVTPSIVGDTTITATFNAVVNTYTITWMVENRPSYSTFEYGQTPTIADPTRNHYDFAGWVPQIVPVTGNATYTATWTPSTYTVRWDPMGGSVSPSTSTGSVEQAAYVPTPVLPYNDFLGWYTQRVGGTKIAEPFYPQSDGLTYFAHWDPIEYTVTFDATTNGGTTDTPDLTGTNSEGVILPNATKEGMRFYGWFVQNNPDSERVGLAGSIYHPTANIKLYALFTTDTHYTYTVDFNYNGGWASLSNLTYTTDQPVEWTFDIPSTEPFGYLREFQSWNTEADGTGATISPGSELEVGPNETVTLYAVWEDDSQRSGFDSLISSIPFIVILGLILSIVAIVFKGREFMSAEMMIATIVGLAVATLAVATLMVPLFSGL